MPAPLPIELRARAVELRSERWTIDSIARALGVNPSTVRGWVAEVTMTGPCRSTPPPTPTRCPEAAMEAWRARVRSSSVADVIERCYHSTVLHGLPEAEPATAPPPPQQLPRPSLDEGGPATPTTIARAAAALAAYPHLADRGIGTHARLANTGATPRPSTDLDGAGRWSDWSP